jgi:hypothetical protein
MLNCWTAIGKHCTAIEALKFVCALSDGLEASVSERFAERDAMRG